MNTRVLINVGVFAFLGAVLAVWAFRNVISFDFIDRPYHVTAEFRSSPGLHPNFEVDYLGMRVGKIDSVRLAGSKVVVRLDIDRGVRIPRGVTAAAARKSAVGEPVVELTPKPGQAGGPAMPTDGSGLIPLADTTTPPAYADLFSAVLNTLKAVDPKDAQILTREFAAGWAGRDDSLRQIIAGSDQLTSTFASNTELIDGLTTDLGQIAHVLAQNRGSLGAGLDNLAALTGALRAVRGELAGIRDRGPELLADVNGILRRSGADIDCMLGALGDVEIKDNNPDYLRDLSRTLDQAGELVHVLDNVITLDQGKKVLNVVFLLTVRTKATLEYKKPLPQPAVGGIPTCPGGRVPAPAEQKDFPGKNPGDTVPTHDPSVNGAAQNVRNAANGSQGDAGGPPDWLVYVPPVIALLVLIKVVTGSLPVMSRLRRRR